MLVPFLRGDLHPRVLADFSRPLPIFFARSLSTKFYVSLILPILARMVGSTMMILHGILPASFISPLASLISFKFSWAPGISSCVSPNSSSEVQGSRPEIVCPGGSSVRAVKVPSSSYFKVIKVHSKVQGPSCSSGGWSDRLCCPFSGAPFITHFFEATGDLPASRSWLPSELWHRGPRFVKVLCSRFKVIIKVHSAVLWSNRSSPGGWPEGFRGYISVGAPFITHFFEVTGSHSEGCSLLLSGIWLHVFWFVKVGWSRFKVLHTRFKDLRSRFTGYPAATSRPAPATIFPDCRSFAIPFIITLIEVSMYLMVWMVQATVGQVGLRFRSSFKSSFRFTVSRSRSTGGSQDVRIVQVRRSFATPFIYPLSEVGIRLAQRSVQSLALSGSAGSCFAVQG